MKFFYSILLGMTRLELQIARSTGRNPEQISQLAQEEQEFLGAIHRLEIQQ